jgi:hypothetical protein
MYKVIREFILFILLAYLAVWMSIVIISSLDLRSSAPRVTQIEEVFLIQLSFFIWILVLLFFYFIRIIIYFLAEKFKSNP